jgi:hypothetical protein
MTTRILSFVVEPLNPPTQMALVATPAIDGRVLSDLVEEFETRQGFDPAGGYGGLVFDFFPYGPLGKYFHGQSDDSESGRGIYVLGCACGEVGCWPLKCRVTADDKIVTWHTISQPHRPARDYSAFGPFLFEAAQYANAVATLQARISGTG